MSPRRYQAIPGAVLICIALFFFLSLIGYQAADHACLISGAPVRNITGPVGAWIAYLFHTIVGAASFSIIPVLVLPGLFLIKSDWVTRTTEKSVLFLFLSVSVAALMSLFMRTYPQMSGGIVGTQITDVSAALAGKAVSYLFVLGLFMVNAIALLIVFLSPKREKFEARTRFSLLTQAVAKRFHFLRKNDNIPLLSIKEQGRMKSGPFPWIIKKRIVVYETEKCDSPLSVLKFPELPVSSSIGDYGLLPEKTSLTLQLKQGSDDSYDDADDVEVVLGEGEYVIDNGPESGSVEYIECAQQKEAAEDEIELDCGDRVITGAHSADSIIEDEDIDSCIETANDVGVDNDPEGIPDHTERVFEEVPINQEYIIPTSYLSSSKPLDSESWKSEIRRNSVLLKNTLAEFGIEAEVTNVNRGPVITLYEMQIAPGIKVNRVVGLADDIAMALAAQRVRIVAPIPGKSAIGVEIPNRYRETVTLGDIVKSEEFQNYDGKLVVALGKDILGNPVMLDLKRLPHLLIAGTTGSGKSVCVNSIITSLIYNYDPNHVRFILVDPKMVELQLYNGLPHLLTPVIVDPQIAPLVLKWTMHEMERRYRLLSDLHTRDIERYNEKIEHVDGAEKLPYIVAIIDEMADLMMTSKEVEGYITRIAQKSRAVGIHLVVATQRPSVDIITGIIKANFPARIAFQVAQRTDSRTIIDQNGAEKLLGRGDMLYQPPTSSFPIRVQGGFISEEEIEKIAVHLRKLGRPSYIDFEKSLLEDDESLETEESTDDLFQEAMKIIEETKKASASYLQRRLSIGYNRAARIIEQMEEMGYIGPQIGSKPREVFI